MESASRPRVTLGTERALDHSRSHRPWGASVVENGIVREPSGGDDPGSTPSPASSSLAPSWRRIAAWLTGGSLAFGRASRTVAGQASPVGPVVGDTEDRLVSCLLCGTPIAAGSPRCPGCGRRLLLDVPLERAIGLAGGGAALGLVGGLVVALALGSLAGPAVRPVGDALPPASAATSSLPSPVAPEAAAALAALEQVEVVNGRLAEAGSELAGLLASSGVDAVALATALRGIAADATVASDFVPRIAPWTPAAPLADDLAAFYGQIRSVARQGLAASLTNEAAYRDAARQMVAVLRSTAGLQDRVAQLLASPLPQDPAGASAAPATSPAGG